jgi:hypothetical protein
MTILTPAAHLRLRVVIGQRVDTLAQALST